jgi:hypothetical protein
VRSDSDAVGNGSSLQLIQAGAGLQVQIWVLWVCDQQTAMHQHPYDAAPVVNLDQFNDCDHWLWLNICI